MSFPARRRSDERIKSILQSKAIHPGLAERDQRPAGIYDSLCPYIHRSDPCFPGSDIDSEFDTLVEGFGVVRNKLGEERYAALIDLAARAKALFAADQDDTNGKTDEG